MKHALECFLLFLGGPCTEKKFVFEHAWFQ